MTNHLAMWHYWMLRDRNRSRASNDFIAGHTAAEKDAFDQQIARLRPQS